MYLRYGNYIHANNEVGFTITRDAKRTQGGTFYAYQEKWSCKGDLLNYASQRPSRTPSRALRRPTPSTGRTWCFCSMTVSRRRLISFSRPIATAARGSSRPRRSPIPSGAGEYQPGYGRSYTFEIEGETQLTNENVLLTFTESVSFKGTGGPIVVYQQRRTGTVDTTADVGDEPLSRHPARRLGRQDFMPGPRFPRPSFRRALINQSVDAGLDSPRRFNRYEYPVSWSYTYQSNTPLAAFPNIATS